MVQPLITMKEGGVWFQTSYWQVGEGSMDLMVNNTQDSMKERTEKIWTIFKILNIIIRQIVLQTQAIEFICSWVAL